MFIELKDGTLINAYYVEIDPILDGTDVKLRLANGEYITESYDSVDAANARLNELKAILESV